MTPAGRDVRQTGQRAQRTLHERPDQDVMTNPRADRVRKVARLAGRSARLREGMFLAEGPQSSREALRAHLGLLPPGVRSLWLAGAVVECVYVRPELADLEDSLADLVRQAQQAGVPVRWAEDAVLDAMADAVNAQGILTVCSLPAEGDALATSILSEEPQAGLLLAVLCRVQDPGNVGTIIRAADAAGADAVVLTPGSVDVFNPKVVRSTAGSLFHLPVLRSVELQTLLATPGVERASVLAADGYGDVRLDQAPPELLGGSTLWLFGNEAQGLSPAELALAEHRVAVPLYGAAESLNVATAATVCLYASAMAGTRGR